MKFLRYATIHGVHAILGEENVYKRKVCLEFQKNIPSSKLNVLAAFLSEDRKFSHSFIANSATFNNNVMPSLKGKKESSFV